jgi:uncharacterized protein YdeI (YjbR/CyaY-like superfamily)
MYPVFFESAQAFREWLETHHNKETELVVGYYKVSTGKPSLNWSESVDQAICFGWIDGIRRSIDEESYCIRFTPRNPNSKWSAVNIKKAQALIASGQMMPAGLKLLEQRKEPKQEVYSYENRLDFFPPDIEERFRQNELAWDNFCKFPPSHRRKYILWMMDAKQQTTFEKRFAQLIAACEEGKRLDLFTSQKKRES